MRNKIYIVKDGAQPEYRTWDIDSPSVPIAEGFCGLQGINEVLSASGNNVFVKELSENFSAFDVSDHENPVLIGSINTANTIYSIAIEDTFAFVANDRAGVRVIDISKPNNICEVTTFNTPGEVYDIAIDGNKAYIADGDSGLKILNISDKSRIKEISRYSTMGNAYNVTVSKNNAYLLVTKQNINYYGKNNISKSKLEIIDVSNARKPKLKSSYTFPDGGKYVTVSEGYVYYSIDSLGIFVVDLRKPKKPITIGRYANREYHPHQIKIFDKFLLFSDDAERLHIVNANIPSDLRELRYYQSPSFIKGFTVSNGYAFLAEDVEDEGQPGLRVIKIDLR